MRKENAIQSIVVVILAVTVLVMSIGYALYAQTLTINGTATFTASKWDVHFDTGTLNETTTVKATTMEKSNTLIEYTVTLPSPGTSYSFTVNAKNFGTIDAKLTKLTMTGLTDAQKKYIEYKVSYNGTEYTQTTDGLAVALAAGASHPVVVTVTYKYPPESTDLPTTDESVDLTLALDYEDNTN